jgi:pimeloyl-ACP methyl ester carboxylesterase
MFKEVSISIKDVALAGHLSLIDRPNAWVIFAHGSGSSRMSSRNNWVASELNKHGYATLLFDLLTSEEDKNIQGRFNLPLLADRLSSVIDWLKRSQYYHGEAMAYFGASTGAGAALMAASHESEGSPLYAVISRGGRPDLAGGEKLKKVSVPVLLIVGSFDEDVIELNKNAQKYLRHSELKLVEGATHLFEEPGTLNQVVDLSVQWLDHFLPRKDYQEAMPG